MMKWITAGDIKNWYTSNKRHCEQTLPELLRNLILATASSVEKIEFPCGDSIAVSGWDGQLKTSATSPFFPTGSSAWEIGTSGSPRKKAEEDYSKRTNNSLGLIRSETTFVFVTPRPWPGRNKWINEKKSANEWKDVQVINADMLEQWLDSAPVVALQLAKKIGKVISSGIRDIKGFWEEWSLETSPQFSIDLIAGGRQKEIEKIRLWLTKTPSLIEVQGDSPDEPFAFLYAAIMMLPEAERLHILSRCIKVENVEQLRECISAFQSPLVIAAPASCREACGIAIQKGHHIFLVANTKVFEPKNILKLSRPQCSVIEKSLCETGFSRTKAQQFARDFGRSIPVLRRQLSRPSNFPEWADVKYDYLLIPFLLAGSWNEAIEGDRQIIEILCGMNYAKFAKELEQFLMMDDSPIYKVATVWMLRSSLDAWFLFARNLTNETLKVYKTCILKILSEIDPKYNLLPEKRFMASMFTVPSQISNWLRTGLVDSLILLAIYGDKAPKINEIQYKVNGIVKELLDSAEKWEAWESLQDILPRLAEAAPDVFIEVLEQRIEKNPEIFQELMKDDTTEIFPKCKHSGLLWALEEMAWHTQYLTRTAMILTKLAQIDTGGQWTNRPINSLKGIFRPGYPQTYATPDERLTLLDKLIFRYPEIVWKFTQGYYGSITASESYRFHWRDTNGTRRGLEPENKEDHLTYILGLQIKLLNLACLRENLTHCLKNFMTLPTNIREQLLQALIIADPAAFTKTEREEIFTQARITLRSLYNRGNGEWISHIKPLEDVLKIFTPDNIFERLGWLLTEAYPQLPQKRLENYYDDQKSVTTVREKAAQEILSQQPIENIILYAQTTRSPLSIGNIIGKVIFDINKDNLIIDTLYKQPIENHDFIIGYSYGRIEVSGSNWVIQQIARIRKEGSYISHSLALLFLGLPEKAETWLAVSAEGKDIEDEYWKYAHGYSVNKDEDCQLAVTKLLDAKRPDRALEIAGGENISLPSSLLQRLMEDFIKYLREKVKFLPTNMYAFHLGHVFNQLYERNELPNDEIAKLEWPFIDLADEISRYTTSPMAIHRILQTDPLAFSQLISFCYKCDDDSEDPIQKEINLTQEERNQFAAQAIKVLQSWKLIPGLTLDATIDQMQLETWMERARSQCTAYHRVSGADLEIGRILSYSPSDSDGMWPHIAIRNLLENLNNKVIEKSIENRICYNRGVTVRSLGEGGQQEEDLANKYIRWSVAMNIKWPRTAALLRSIAETFSGMAKNQDISIDLLSFSK